MTKRLFRVSEGLCHCKVADAKVGDQKLAVTEIGDGGALVATEAEFAVNEYIDVTIGFDGIGDEALFAHVVSSGEGGLRLRWLHFDPSESERLGETLGKFGEQHGLEPEEVADEEPPKKKKKETRRIVRPRTSANGAGDEGGEPKAKTRRVTRPSGKQAAVDTDAFAEADAKDDTPAPKRHETTSITPFGGNQVVADKAPTPPSPSPPSPGSTKRNTRKISKPSGKSPAVRDGGDSPFEESGEATILAGTEQFKKMDQAKVEAKPKTVTIRKNVVGDDGKLDVGASIRSRAKTVRASELAAKHDKLRVLNMSTIKELIQDAVQEALNRLGGSIDQAEKERLLKEAEEEFQERLKEFKAEKQGWEAQQKNLESQLERAQRLLDDEKNKVVEADQFTVSEKGMEDLEKRFNRLVNAAIKANGVSGPLADELQTMVANLLDAERERIAEQAQQAQSEAIKLLEKKVARLAGSLEDSEKEANRAKRRAAALEAAGGGVAGQAIYSEFEDEEDKARKLELLKVVFDQNKEMRDAMDKKGVKIKPRKRPAPPPKPEEAADVPADEVEKDEPQQPAAAAEAAVADEPAEPVSDDAYDDGVDPDDMPWVPGTKLDTDIKGDNEDDDEDDGIKKITAPTDFKIPDLAALKAKASEGGG